MKTYQEKKQYTKEEAKKYHRNRLTIRLIRIIRDKTVKERNLPFKNNRGH